MTRGAATDSVATAWVERTRREQGLPDEIEDGEALRRLAALLLGRRVNPEGDKARPPPERGPRLNHTHTKNPPSTPSAERDRHDDDNPPGP